MINALTIDVEDYFQVHAFSDIIQYENWENYKCRVERNVNRILEILNDSTHDSALNTQQFSGPSPHPSPRAPYASVKATFFVLGWIAERYPNLIRKIHAQGHEIACHGYAHRLIYHQSKEEFRKDIKRAKAILEDISGIEISGYRAPSYSITNRSRWAFEILVEEGFKYDSSIFPIKHDFYGMPNAPRFPFLISVNGNSNVEFSTLSFDLDKTQHSAPMTQNLRGHGTTAALDQSVTLNSELRTMKFIPNAMHLMPYSPKANLQSELISPHLILEFPISTVRLLGQNLPISGGGYFRLFPYPIVERGLRRINNQEKEPFIFYIHPWEFDVDQPRFNNGSRLSKFRHYVNLNKTEGRFRKLLKDFKFSTVREIIEH